MKFKFTQHLNILGLNTSEPLECKDEFMRIYNHSSLLQEYKNLIFIENATKQSHFSLAKNGLFLSRDYFFKVISPQKISLKVHFQMKKRKKSINMYIQY